MPKYIIRANWGFGDDYDIILADDEEDAQRQAYEFWKDSAEMSADYDVVGEATDELKAKYGL